MASLCVAIVGLKANMNVYYNDFGFKTRATMFWSCALFLTMLSSPNVISNFYGQWSLLRRCGKYSFSIYLLQIGVIGLVGKFVKTQNPLERVLICLLSVIVVGFFSFNLVENQLIRMGNVVCARLEKIWRLMFVKKELGRVSDCENISMEHQVNKNMDDEQIQII